MCLDTNPIFRLGYMIIIFSRSHEVEAVKRRSLSKTLDSMNKVDKTRFLKTFAVVWHDFLTSDCTLKSVLNKTEGRASSSLWTCAYCG